jgi:DNA-binding MarR family transcriptional regulator
MVDIKTRANPLFLREEELRQGIELLFFAYRDFTAEPDSMLAELGMGRHPGITVTDLLRILKITKQSLSRVLSQLIREAYIEQRQGRTDRRQKPLHLTAKGVALEQALTANQLTRIAGAYKAASAEAVEGFCKVLLGMIDESDQRRFIRPGRPEDPAAGGRSTAAQAVRGRDGR